MLPIKNAEGGGGWLKKGTLNAYDRSGQKARTYANGSDSCTIGLCNLQIRSKDLELTYKSLLI